jgi:hypothetical protein
MKIDKLNNTYDFYKLEVSFGELAAMLNAFEAQSGQGPVHDDMQAAIRWYMDRIPGPGEDKEEFKQKKDAEKELNAGTEGGLEQASNSDLALPAEKSGPPMEPGSEHGGMEDVGKEADKVLPKPPLE